MSEFLQKFERLVLYILAGLLSVVVILATVELGWTIIDHIATGPLFLLEPTELMQIFGVFLLVLIGIELLETIKAYLVEEVVHVEIVLEVALIAIARKVIIIDIDTYDSLTLLGVAAVIAAVTLAFYAVKRLLARTAGHPKRGEQGK